MDNAVVVFSIFLVNTSIFRASDKCKRFGYKFVTVCHLTSFIVAMLVQTLVSWTVSKRWFIDWK